MEPSSELIVTARRLAELGNPTRLSLFRLLVRAGHDGLTVSTLRDRADLPMSTMTFHLRGLVASGLVSQSREGRVVRCRATFPALDEVVAYLQRECCLGFDEGCAPGAASARTGEGETAGR